MGRSDSGIRVLRADPADLDAAIDALGAAFAADPLIDFLFQAAQDRRDERSREFFRLLMSARLALGMPVFVAKDGDRIAGAVMGYDTTRPDWPAPLAQRWEALMRSVPGFQERLASYENLADRHMPSQSHYYLGVLGVAPDYKGRSIGSALIRSFCGLSAADPRSAGVYLETAGPANLPFYRRAGFVETGQGPLGNATLWCMFHVHERRAP